MPGLESVIKAASSDTAYDRGCQALIAIETKSGRPVAKGSIFRPCQYFLVTNSKSPSAMAERTDLIVPIRDFTRDRSLDMAVDYRLQCPPGQEAQLAAAVHRSPSPAEAIDGMVTSWIREFIGPGRDGQFIDAFRSLEGRLRDHLSARAQRELGVLLSVRIRSKGAAEAEPFARKLRVPVVASDCTEPLELTVNLELDSYDGADVPPAATQRPPDALERHTKETIRRFFAQHVSLRAYHEGLQTEVHGLLVQHLNSTLAGEGRTVVRMSIEGTPIEAPKQLLVPHRFPCRVPEYSNDVTIESQMLLKLRDVARYYSAGKVTLESWARDNLEALCREYLFKVTYTDLCIQFDALRRCIEMGMKAAASAIGYDIDHFVTITDLRLHKLYEQWYIEIPDVRLPTKDPSVHVGLAIFVHGRLKESSKIVRYLNQNMDVEEAARRRAVEAARYLMCEVDPESFYIYFETARQAGKPSVERRLRNALTDALTTDLGMEIRQVTCNRLETDISLLFKDLIQKPCDVRVVVAPRGGGEEISFDGTFDVYSVLVEGWRNFVRRRPTLDVLAEAVEKHLKERLSEMSVKWLLNERYDEMKRQIDGTLRASVGARFGVDIRMESWSRRLTAHEERRAKNMQMVAGVRGEVDTAVLDARRTAALQRLGMEQEEIARLRRELDKVQEAHDAALQEEPERARVLWETLEELRQRLAKKLNDIGMIEPDVDSEMQDHTSSWTPLATLAAYDSDERCAGAQQSHERPLLEPMEGDDPDATAEPGAESSAGVGEVSWTDMGRSGEQGSAEASSSGEGEAPGWWLDGVEVTESGEQDRGTERRTAER